MVEGEEEEEAEAKVETVDFGGLDGRTVPVGPGRRRGVAQ